ncbi:hypothetical protein C8R43DRAFT_1034134 [Mycena crocata]|nr:hypothetical protein C8R43DRAFT_1034134 [Mycena crocata]
MDCQFSFGANGSYLFRAGSNIAWSDNLIPHRLEHLLENKSQTFGNMYDVAFPIEEGLYMASWYTNTEEDRYEDAFLGPNYARLARFMAQVAKNSGHTMQTVFGPNYSYFSFSTSGYSWQNIPPALENDILNSMKTRLPTAVALGLEASYVVVYSDGTVSADLNGYYPALESLISDGSKEATRSAMTVSAMQKSFVDH